MCESVPSPFLLNSTLFSVDSNFPSLRVTSSETPVNLHPSSGRVGVPEDVRQWRDSDKGVNSSCKRFVVGTGLTCSATERSRVVLRTVSIHMLSSFNNHKNDLQSLFFFTPNLGIFVSYRNND